MESVTEYEYKRRLYAERLKSLDEFVLALTKGGDLILENCFEMSDDIEEAIINLPNIAGYNVAKDVLNYCKTLRERYESDLEQHLLGMNNQKSKTTEDLSKQESREQDSKGEAGNEEV